MKRYYISSSQGDELGISEDDSGEWVHIDDVEAAIKAAVEAERKAIVSWLWEQRNEVPATGEEFSNALREVGKL